MSEIVGFHDISQSVEKLIGQCHIIYVKKENCY